MSYWSCWTPGLPGMGAVRKWSSEDHCSSDLGLLASEHVGDGPLVSKKQQRRDELIFAVRASVESSFSPPSQSCCPTPGRG